MPAVEEDGKVSLHLPYLAPGRVIFLSSTLKQERVNNPRLGVQRLMAVESRIY